ncbi:Alpha/Beta hydrolase protein [Flagelloscypha sp. PMI_526]|nr:Alpha/Beta hydrolase protein [Flagelloscypha sp. PMI_526]
MSNAWGPEAPFKITIPQSSLDDLQQRLSLARLPDELDAASWSYGAPLSDVKRLVQRWKTDFNWRKCEDGLNNEFPQFKRDIDVEGFGRVGVHYVHQKSKVVDAIPLVFIHGWPGSFIEVRHILPLLVQAGDNFPAFHVVALSLPNFGFSDGVKKKGFKLEQHGEVAHKLMLSLGYHEYVAQGGDWGYGVARRLAVFYPKSVKGWHTNFPLPPLPTLWNPLIILRTILCFVAPVTAQMSKDKANLEVAQKVGLHEQGYLKIQSTKPQTLGYSLADSPVGLLAWIYEKLVGWTDGYKWTDDQVLEWVSIYWFSTAGPAASVRLYYEAMEAGANGDGGVQGKFTKPQVPFGCSYFPREIVTLPPSWSHLIGNLVFEGQHTSGGHFAAHEVPELLVGDLRRMFGKGGPAFGVVGGRSGYA